MPGLTGSEGNHSDMQTLEALREQLQRIQSQKNDLIKDIVDLRQQNHQMSEACRRSVLHFVSMLKPLVDPRTAKALDAFKVRLVPDPDWLTLERAIQKIKTCSLHEACEAAPSGNSVGTHEPLNDAGPPPPPLPDFLTVHHLLLDSLRGDFGDMYRQKWETVSSLLDGCQPFTDLLAGSRQLADLARHFHESLMEERSSVARFFSEIGQDLAEMETLLHVTVRHSRETREASEAYTTTLDGQMQEMRDSVMLTRTLEELKTVVESRLAAIKNFLKEKRQQDEARHREAGQNTEALQQALKKMKHEVSTMQERTRILEEQVVRDPLTGIHNRRAFDMRLEEEFHRFQRYGQVFSLLVIDVDHFKQVNDVYGHTIGDQCLLEITQRMATALRKSDFLARYGGEEFVVLLPGVLKEGALNVAEKLRLSIEKTRFLYQGKRIPLTISVGVAQPQLNEGSPQQLFKRADDALYAAKKQGRNRVVVAEDDPAEKAL